MTNMHSVRLYTGRFVFLLFAVFAGFVNIGCERSFNQLKAGEEEQTAKSEKQNVTKATFAGGCFWCMEPPFEKLDGVNAVISGYMGGKVKNPSYRQVSSGGTGHLEVVQVRYRSDQISYKKLLEVFWRQIDPTDAGGQFVDRGHQYTTRIFYHSKRQKKLAETSRKRLAESGIFDEKIVTNISPAKTFYRAEAYHQDFYKKSTSRYKSYRSGSGRDEFLRSVWKDHQDFQLFESHEPKKSTTSTSKTNMYTKPDQDELKNKLSDLQYRVTQKDATEPPYNNKYWDNKREGIYVDVVSGEPLFSSKAKFKSGTGWPSFSKPLVEENIVTRPDHSTGTVRMEVRSKHADSHLGHVFKDGPEPTGLRYCINSAALEFIPADQLEKRGYGTFKSLFQDEDKASEKD